MNLERVCLVPHVYGVGGMVSFQQKLTAGLADKGIEVADRLSDQPYQAVLVIAGTRDLVGLIRARRAGIPIIQRLDGMNWLHRRLHTGVRHFLKAEYGNFLLALIRKYIADRIVYQSEFSRCWWERVHGPTRIPNRVVYNGVDLETYLPGGNRELPDDHWRVLLVEGSLAGGYEIGLETAVRIAEGLESALEQERSGAPEPRPVELMVVGFVAPEMRAKWDQRGQIKITWKGQVAQEMIPAIDRSAHLLYAADLNAACPNSVIEALACGLPVIAFDTGALKELVSGNSGRVVPYGSDPWTLSRPDVPAMVQAALSVLSDQPRLRKGARKEAEARFGLAQMTSAYIQSLVGW